MAISVRRWTRGGWRASSLRARRGEKCATDSATDAACVLAAPVETRVLELPGSCWSGYLASLGSLSILPLFIHDEDCKMAMAVGPRLGDNCVTKPRFASPRAAGEGAAKPRGLEAGVLVPKCLRLRGRRAKRVG